MTKRVKFSSDQISIDIPQTVKKLIIHVRFWEGNTPSPSGEGFKHLTLPVYN